MSNAKKTITVTIVVTFVILLMLGISLFINSDIGIYMLGSREMQKDNYIAAIIHYSKILHYKDANNKLNECHYQIAIKNIEANEYEKAIENLSKLNNYKNSTELMLDSRIALIEQYINRNKIIEASNLLKDVGINYNDRTNNLYILIEEKLAELNYEDGLFKEAIEHFNNAKVQNKLLENCQKLLALQGTFENGIIINGWKIYIEYINTDGETRVVEKKYTYLPEKNVINISNTQQYFYLDSIYLTDDYFYYYMKGLSKRLYFSPNKSGKTEFVIKKNKLVWKENKETYTISKINSNTSKPEEKIKPKIGMNKLEVQNSSWGSPKKINKTTTAYGVHEQWVYSGYKYLYFDNGILTSIQD